VPSPSAYAVSSRATSGAGGFETSTTSSTDGSRSSRSSAVRVARPPTSAERSRPPTPYAVVTPTPAWSRRASSCWQPVPDAATMPTGPGATTLAKPSPSPSTTAVPQSGPITSRSRAAAYVLSATSCSSGTLSLNTITSLPASSASIASTAALAPGTETSTSAPGSRSSAEVVVRGGASSVGPSGRRLLAVRARSTSATTPSSSAGSSIRTATTRWLTPASTGSVNPIRSSTSTLSGVAIATCAVTTPGSCCTCRLTWSRVTESA
jgi:hypothetical protein